MHHRTPPGQTTILTANSHMSTTHTWIHDSRLRPGTGNFLLEQARKLHRYACSEATADDEHAFRWGAMRAQPVPRRTRIDREALFAWRARRVRKAAIVRREHVRAKPRRVRLVVLHAGP